MIKIINNILSFLKVILLLVCFVFCLFIIINMYIRLDKNLFNALFNFIPFVLLFILFSINFIFKQKSVNRNVFYNVTCCLVFVMILFSVYRTFFDKNMIFLTRLGYGINFNYFADMISPIKAMLYFLSLSNVLLMVDGLNFDNKLVSVDDSVPAMETETKVKSDTKTQNSKTVKVSKTTKSSKITKTGKSNK